MTPTVWISAASLLLTLLLNGGILLVAFGRWSESIEALKVAIATKATTDEHKALLNRVGTLERDMREVEKVTAAVDSIRQALTHMETTAKLREELILEKVSGLDRMLDHKLRNLRMALEGKSFKPTDED